MFYDLPKKEKKNISIIIFIVSYLLLTVAFGLSKFISNGFSFSLFFQSCKDLWYLKIGLSLLVVYLLVWLANNSMEIKAEVVGDGQHGTGRYATEEEKKETFTYLDFGDETKPGIVIDIEKHTRVVDTSDNNVSVIASPGGGKSTRFMIPNIVYNALCNKRTGGQGASMILTDLKGLLLRATHSFLKKCGYTTFFLNFRDPFNTYCFNLMYNVNLAVDEFKSAKNKKEELIAMGKSERYAKVLAESIVQNMEKNSGSSGENYFEETAQGLITALVLLVSSYGKEGQRHIISVFKLIIELNGLVEGESKDELQKNKLDELLSHIDNDRIINYAGASIKADVRTSMNVFSSALSKLASFVDAELEQMVCKHSPEINAVDFVNKPTAVFLICPDENTTRHFFASLFIRYFFNDLIELAEKEYKGVLPRLVLCLWDEFGNFPPIKDIDVLFSAVRSRNIRIVVTLQSNKQLEKHYSATKAEIIRDTIQMVFFTFLAPGSLKTAKEFSQIMGTKTVSTGSVNKGKGVTTSRNMMKRELAMVDEIIFMPQGQFVLLKSGIRPLKTKLPYCYSYLDIEKDEEDPVHENEATEIVYLSAQSIVNATIQAKTPIFKGMFD